MSLFSVLPITVNDPTLPVLQMADVNAFDGLEFSAFDHWIFDEGSAAGLTGKRNALALTPLGTSPTYSSNYITMSTATGKGLASTLIDDGRNWTGCAVVRTASSGTQLLFGTMGSSTGGSPFFSGADPNHKLFNTFRGMLSSDDTGQVAPTGSYWYFVACSLDADGKSVKTLVGGGAGDVSTSATSYVSSGNAIALGNGYYTTGSAANMDFAEFILFDRALNAADLTAIYNRSKARLAERGITVV